MPVWGKALKGQLRGGMQVFQMGARGVQVASNPQMALRMAIMQVLSTLGLSFIMPIVSMAISLLQVGLKAHIDAEVKRIFELERKKLYTEVYAAITEQDRELFRELVPG
jgi:hypothetical protein